MMFSADVASAFFSSHHPRDQSVGRPRDRDPFEVFLDPKALLTASISAPSPAPPEVISVAVDVESSRRRLLAGIGLNRFGISDVFSPTELPPALACGRGERVIPMALPTS